MFDIPKEYENLVNIVFLIVTAAIAYHGLTFRRPDGVGSDWVRLLFGCIAGVYFFLVLFKDIFESYIFLKFTRLMHYLLLIAIRNA